MDAPATALHPDTYIDPAAMAALMQRGLPGYRSGQWTIEGARLWRVRRSASRRRNPCPIAVCYALDVREPGSGRRGEQLVYGKAYRGGSGGEAFARLDTAALATPAYGPPAAHLAEADMVVWSLPNDPGLPQLPALLQGGGRFLPAAMSGGGAGAQTEMLRYEPEERATLRLRLRPGEPAIYGKTFCDQRGREIARRFEHFWQQSALDSGAPLVARPLGYAPAGRVFWQAAAEGRPLTQVLDEVRDPAPMVPVARALARLHGSTLEGIAPRAPGHWAEEARRRRVKISRALPPMAESAARAEAAIARHSSRFGSVPQGLIHGDFHIDQVWLQGERPLFFDFDEFAQGDPLEDLAACLVRLSRRDWPACFVAALAQTLIDEYARCIGRQFDPQRLHWHLAVQHLVQASRAFVFQKPDWQQELASMLARAELAIGALESGEEP